MESDDPASAAALRWTDSGWPDTHNTAARADDSAAAVGALYQSHAVGLIRLAYLMLGDRPSAEDAVQDAFCGLYRQREALVLRFYLDLPEREIARIMGLRPGSVRSATHRALKALGLSLEEGS